jgi:hypothetical protein
MPQRCRLWLSLARFFLYGQFTKIQPRTIECPNCAESPFGVNLRSSGVPGEGLLAVRVQTY